jgi:O-antigen/teichoic acid export membrane protein
MSEPESCAPGEAANSVDATRGPGRFGSDVRWSYVLQGGRILATTAITFILARFLGPESFGVVALATVYCAFVEMVFLDPLLLALVQRKSLTAEHKDAAFWLVCASSMLPAVITIALSGALARFYELPDLSPVLTALAIGIPARGVSIVHEALLQRDLLFRQLTLRTHLSIVLGGAAGVAAALMGLGVWALVIQQLTTTVIGSAALWLVYPWRPRARWSRQAARELRDFAAHSAVSSVGMFLGDRSDIVVMGYFFGPVAIGIYRLAFRLVDMVLSATARSMQFVSMPHLARLQDDPVAFGRRLLSAQRLVAVTTIPALGLLAGGAEPVVRLLGAQWSAAVPVLRLLCIAGVLMVFAILGGPVLQALGRPDLVGAFCWARGAVSISSYLIAGGLTRNASIVVQLVAIGIAFAVVQVVFGCVAMRMVARRTTLSIRDQLFTAVPATVASIIAAITMVVSRADLGFSELPPILDATVSCTVGVVVGGAGLLVMDADLRRTVIHFLSSRMRSISAPVDGS